MQNGATLTADGIGIVFDVPAADFPIGINDYWSDLSIAQ